MFDDRRNVGERRNHIARDTVPMSGCRRGSGERRHLLRQYHPQPWWLQANYVEELQPPVLASPFRSPPPSTESRLESPVKPSALERFSDIQARNTAE